MRVLVTGASGLVGSALVPALRAQGHEVLVAVRRPPDAPDEVFWAPEAGNLEPGQLAGLDAAVHLAGAGIGDHRWTPRYMDTVRSSRTRGTALLSTTLAGLDPRPRVLLSGSATGYYGETGEHPADETAPPGEGFLASVCRDWEHATEPAEEAGIRVAHLRSGVVLSARGGALARQLPLFRAGLGGRLGSGRQYLSWISLADEVAAIRYLLDSAAIGGPVNLTAPEPVTQADFARTLARSLGRPSVARIPGLALKVALGGIASEGLLVNQRVIPRVLGDAGFTFHHPTLADALTAELGAPRPA